MNTQIIYGHTGFIGNKYILNMSKECHIIKASNIKDELTNGQANIIINFSGSSSVKKSFDYINEDFSSSVQFTLELITSLLKKTHQTKLILLSSAAVYGNKPNLLNEGMTLNPISPYGIHKMLMETMAMHYQYLYDLNVTIIRPFSIYGEGQKKQLLWDACEKLTNNKNEFFGTGEEVRDWLHVDDLTSLIYLASQQIRESSSSYDIFNAGGNHFAISEILDRVAFHLKSKIRPIFNGMEDNGNPSILISNSNKAKNTFNWAPQVDIDTGIKRYVEWYLGLKNS